MFWSSHDRPFFKFLEKRAGAPLPAMQENDAGTADADADEKESPAEPTDVDWVSEIEARVENRIRQKLELDRRVWWRRDPSFVSPFDIRVEQDGDSLTFFSKETLRNGQPQDCIKYRAATALSYCVLAGPTVGEMSFNLSDGNVMSQAKCAFSASRADIHLVPDHYFFAQNGYSDVHEAAQNQYVTWNDRSDALIWRGWMRGAGFVDVDPLQAFNPVIPQRLRMAMRASDLGMDFRFVAAKNEFEEYHLRQAGYFGDRIPTETWFGHKYAFDVDGGTNTWDNMFTRMIQGCCILKVASQMGYRQWYYDRLHPWVHYVPIRADLSDLEEKIAWCRDNDDAAREIGENGRALATEMTFEAEMEKVGESLRQFVKGKST